jgi:hypothetical protein
MKSSARDQMLRRSTTQAMKPGLQLPLKKFLSATNGAIDIPRILFYSAEGIVNWRST